MPAPYRKVFIFPRSSPFSFPGVKPHESTHWAGSASCWQHVLPWTPSTLHSLDGLGGLGALWSLGSLQQGHDSPPSPGCYRVKSCGTSRWPNSVLCSQHVLPWTPSTLHGLGRAGRASCSLVPSNRVTTSPVSLPWTREHEVKPHETSHWSSSASCSQHILPWTPSTLHNLRTTGRT